MLPDLLRLFAFPEPSRGLVTTRSLLSLVPSGTRDGLELLDSK
jgi:hypothetical protein